MTVVGQGPGWTILKSEDGIIYAKVEGDADDAEVLAYLEVWQRLVEESAPCLHLLDASGIELTTLARRWELASRMKENRHLFKKSAVVGLEGAKRIVASVVIKASRRDNVRIFETVEEAEAWLRS